MANEVILTKEGLEKLQKELEELKGPTRMRLAEAIREAKSHGDLKENAAYHEAKLNQARIEGRIMDLEKLLQIAKIVERPEATGDLADLGSKVTLEDLEWGDSLTITLVGSFEADPGNDLISITSPLGEAVLGKGVNEEFEVDAPGGKQKYCVRAID